LENTSRRSFCVWAAGNLLAGVLVATTVLKTENLRKFSYRRDCFVIICKEVTRRCGRNAKGVRGALQQIFCVEIVIARFFIEERR